MPRLSEEELKAMVAKNPDVTIEDNGKPMGDKPEFEFKTMKQIVAEVGEGVRAREYEKEAGPMLTIEHEPGPKYKSATEKRAHRWLEENTDAIEVLYEPIMVRMPSGNYTPDFVCRMPDRTLWIVEVKGDWKAYQSGRSSKKSLIEASRTFWFLGRWFSLVSIAKKRGGGWDFKEIT